ncbi:hypothetical protein ABET52_18935, partial [Saccharococcus caldoxylosilyticus]|uniref:hypothetical protein n=1 Tax=Saccharococcus caldoxylosilyticus TaxID=81408 RepID=UPI003D341FA1
ALLGFFLCLASAPSSLLPNNLPPRSASTSAGEEQLASRAHRGASAFLSGYLVFKEQGYCLEFTSLLPCAEESSFFEFTGRRRRKIN